MTCEELREIASEYIEKQAPQNVCERVMAHLEECPECLAVLRELEGGIRLCRDLRTIDPPPALDPIREAILRDAYAKALAARRSSA